MANKYLMISMNDDSAKHLADVLSNKTARKILDVLAEKELSENDIAKELNIPINTVEYNLKKLVLAKLIEHSKSFFWSVKGKKIPVYKISNKSIIISPKKSITTGLLATLVVSGLAAVGIRSLEVMKTAPILMKSEYSEAVPMAAGTAVSSSLNFGSISLWFFGGALFSLALYLIITNVRRLFK